VVQGNVRGAQIQESTVFRAIQVENAESSHNYDLPSQIFRTIGQGTKRLKSLLTASERSEVQAENSASEVVNRAYDLRLTFDLAGKQLDWPKVLAAQSQEEVVAAFEQMEESYRKKFLYNLS